MKTHYAVSFFYAVLTAAGLAALQPGEIIPKFYQLLEQEENPKAKDESEFFGGNENNDVRTMLSSKQNQFVSETPIWDYVRKNKFFFVTRGGIKRHIQVSPPVEMTRLSQTVQYNEKIVFVYFPTAFDEHNACTDMSVGMFTLGKNCYINIGSTSITSSQRLLLDHLYHDFYGVKTH